MIKKIQAPNNLMQRDSFLSFFLFLGGCLDTFLSYGPFGHTDYCLDRWEAASFFLFVCLFLFFFNNTCH